MDSPCVGVALAGSVCSRACCGSGLLVRLCETAAAMGKTVYFLGGSPGAASCAASRLSQELPLLTIAGVDCPPHGFLDNPDECIRVAGRIESARPDLLFVGLGAPSREYWIERYSYLPAKVMMGIGGSFEFVAGFRKRAPLMIQKIGFEWFWRLTHGAPPALETIPGGKYHLPFRGVQAMVEPDSSGNPLRSRRGRNARSESSGGESCTN